MAGPLNQKNSGTDHRGGSKGKRSYTVGYWYGLGAHLALCHGPVDAVTEIRVGERVAWSGNVTASTTITIDSPTLFGGKEREAGVQGAVDVPMGEAAQGKNAYLQGVLGSAIPAFRGSGTALTPRSTATPIRRTSSARA